jgi:hypothetical protein
VLNNKTLRLFQSGTDDELYTYVTDAALYMATGGFLDEANQLLSTLWALGFSHDRKTWLADSAFMILWEAAGKCPEFIPFPLENIDNLEKSVRGYIAMDKWAYTKSNLPLTELSGQDLLREALITASIEESNGGNPLYRVQSTDHFPSAQHEKAAIDMLEKLASEKHVSYDGFALGAELAARQGDQDTAIRFAKRCVTGYHDNYNYSAYYFKLLACCRHVAPLLLKRIVADELQVSETTVDAFLTQAIAIIHQRGKIGRFLVYKQLSWKDLLRKMSTLSLQEAPDDYDAQSNSDQWLGLPPASLAAINKTEQRIGFILPDDYKAFLTISNGFPAFPLVNPPILPVEEIDFLKNVDPDLQFFIELACTRKRTGSVCQLHGSVYSNKC